MTTLLFAAGWNDFAAILPIVVAVLVWVISHFAGQIQPKAPPRRPVQPAPPKGNPPQPASDSLRAEIDEFLRQAQAAREGRPANAPRRESQTQPNKTSDPVRSRPPRRVAGLPTRRGARKDETRPVPRLHRRRFSKLASQPQCGNLWRKALVPRISRSVRLSSATCKRNRMPSSKST